MLGLWRPAKKHCGNHPPAALRQLTCRAVTSPTQLSLREMRRRGYNLVVVTEHNQTIMGRTVKHDLFGFGDILALGKDETVVVQTTSYSNITARIRKITEHENLAAVREAGWTILVHGWYQAGKGKPYVLKREVDLS